MIIRYANQNDIQQLTSIKRPTDEHRARFAEIHANRLAQAPEGKAVYLVAEDAGEIVGHVFLKFYGSETDPDYPNLEDLYVREDRRGSSIRGQKPYISD
jgi:predicted N-acetyltransferase YhbS